MKKNKQILKKKTKLPKSKYDRYEEMILSYNRGVIKKSIISPITYDDSARYGTRKIYR